ncbi:calpain family cysteine protease [Porphyromonas gulae]|uniref:calpain family cysteine protease n=1 Tax=Porphyromonas gulae TaxID=111105 RepID=UPI00051CCB17|nr:calpain family cysteine protease [Porphyromonas gulae]KGL47895.1 peptidase [Porphyromonas gulae]
MAKKLVSQSISKERLQKLEAAATLTPQQEEAKARKIEREKARLKELNIPTESKESKDCSPAGMINPYALTEVILERPLDWSNPRTTDIVERVLGSSMQDLSKGDSVLRAGRDQNAEVKIVDSVLTKTQRGQDGLERILESFNDYDMPPEEKEEAAPKAKKAAQKLDIDDLREQALSSTTITKEISKIILPTKNLRDDNNTVHQYREVGFQSNGAHNLWDTVVQGIAGDCYMLAALSAIAWVWPALLNMDVDIMSNQDEWRLYRYFIGRSKQTYARPSGSGTSTNEILQEGYYKVPIFARSRYWFNGEYWPALFEQAYANWKFPNDSKYNAILQIGGGWPEEALCELSGDSWFTSSGKLMLSSFTDLSLLNFMKSMCYSWKTIKPMVIVTPCWEPLPPMMPGIAAYHAYTVLGYTVSNGAYYLIIRNPWGVTEPTGDGVLSKRDWVIHFDNMKWFNLSKDDGIFALRLDKVRENFWYIAYMY